MLFALGCLAAYQQLFSTFAAYDDEGYVMLSLDGYRRVGGLYERVFTQYGPAYFVLQSAFHDLTQLPIAHDVARLRTLLFGAATCIVCGIALWRSTRSFMLSALAAVMMLQHLDRLALEPGHPQEWCVLLVAVTWLTSTFAFDSRYSRRGLMLLLGICCGTLAMIKPNLGLLLAIAVVLVIVQQMRASWLRTGLYWLGGLFACALPWVLARSKLDDPSALQLIVVTSTSTCLVLIKLWPARLRPQNSTTSFSGLSHLAMFVTSCGLTASLFCVCALATGTSLHGLIDGLILQHASFGQTAFYRPAPLPAWTLWWVLTMTVMFWLDARSHNISRYLRLGLVLMVTATAVAQIFDAARPLEHGTMDRSLASWWIALVAPCAWIICGEHTAARTQPFGVSVLALAAVLQPLGAFPVPGTQLAIGSVLLVAVGWYGLNIVRAEMEVLQSTLRSLPSPRLLATALLLLICTSVVWRDSVCTARRYQYTALRLPGTSGLRLPDSQVEELRWMVAELRSRGDTFVFRAHTRGSLYYWTQMPPPTWCNATCWPYLLKANQQQEIVNALKRHPRACAVDEPYSAPLPVWTSPLLRYLNERFTPVASGSYFRIHQQR